MSGRLFQHVQLNSAKQNRQKEHVGKLVVPNPHLDVSVSFAPAEANKLSDVRAKL